MACCPALPPSPHAPQVDVPIGAAEGAGGAETAYGRTARALNPPEVGPINDRIRGCLAQLEYHRKRKAFFSAFSAAPGEFISALVASQSRDLELLSDSSVKARAAEARSEFYRQPWVEDAVMRYLQRRGQIGFS